MTSQRIFPFYVNGEFWRSAEVSKEDILHGYSIQYFSTKIPKDPCYDLKDDLEKATMKSVRFQLAEIRQVKGDFLAEWFDGFWIVDDDLQRDENGDIFVKEKE